MTPVQTAQCTATRFTVVATPDSSDIMSRLGVQMAFAKDEEIYGQDEDADLIYQVVSGAVRTSRLMSDGRRQIGDFYYAGEMFGLEGSDRHRFSAEALSNCVILVIKASAIRLAAGGEAFEQMVRTATRQELDRTQEHLLLLGRKTACERVASFLMGLAEQARGEAVNLPMGRQDMADYLGLTIETVSRMLTQLQATLVVEFTSARQFRISNRSALTRMAA